MRIPCRFIDVSPGASRLRNTCLFVGLCVTWVVSWLFLASLSAYGASGHGCAPTTPPPVSGTLTPPPPDPGIILVNEVLNQPHSAWNCSDPPGTFSVSADSWIEIFNPQSQPLDLYAAHTAISLDGGSNWYYLPLGSAIAPGGFLTIFPEKDLASVSTNWSLMLAIGGVTIDAVNVPSLLPDQSYARVPDGAGDWSLTGHPTIDATNDPASQPITVTPGKTPVSSKTPTPSTSTVRSRATPITIGTQPAWGNVQLPSQSTPLAATPTHSPGLPLSSSQISINPGNHGSGDGWHVVLLAALGILLGAMLFWGWWLFKTP